MAAGTLTERLIELIEAREISDRDREHAALLVLDAVANVIGGRATAPGRILVQWAEAEPPSARTHAFLMGGLTHILEMDDLHKASVVHPGCVVVPAAWAVAEREAATGTDFLLAVVRGFEAMTRVGMAAGAEHYRIWHSTATCGPFGSAYAAGSLLGLDAPAMVDALGNASDQASGPWQFLESGAMTKHLHAGRAAAAGVLAADLAKRGFTGPPRILEGAKGFFAAMCPDADPGAVTRGADAPWQLTLTSVKPWPSCRHTHPLIDACLEIGGLADGDAIERIEIETYPAALDVCDRPAPETEYEAKFSLQHCAAAALTRDTIDFDAFSAAARAALRPLAGRVHVEAAEPYVTAYPGAWGAAVTVFLADGTTRKSTRANTKGDPENPITSDDMIAKARMLLTYGGISAAEADSLIEGILGLAKGGPMPRLPIAHDKATQESHSDKPTLDSSFIVDIR